MRIVAQRANERRRKTRATCRRHVEGRRCRWCAHVGAGSGERGLSRDRSPAAAIAKRRAGLDVEEARWLREADKQRIWRKLGFSTALEYLEDVFGYAPRTAMERMRVAKELGELRGLENEMRSGRLSWSAAKELSRVMTSATEAAWLARARGKNLRDIEELVAGHKKGDEPDTEKDPDLMKRRLVLELSPRVDALLQQCRSAAADELGHHVDDVDLVEMLCRSFLQPAAAIETADTARASHRGSPLRRLQPRLARQRRPSRSARGRRDPPGGVRCRDRERPNEDDEDDEERRRQRRGRFRRRFASRYGLVTKAVAACPGVAPGATWTFTTSSIAHTAAITSIEHGRHVLRAPSAAARRPAVDHGPRTRSAAVRTRW